MLYADRRFKVLVVLQGTDTSGKDGTIRGVFSKTSALGVRTAAWKAPSERRARPRLPVAHPRRRCPAAGEIVIFNRSHYEDVLVPVVKGWIDRERDEQRYAQINAFEQLLCETGTVVLKFMLHISKDEQRQRLQERLDDPTKHWKFAVGDLEERKRWDAYQAAYARRDRRDRHAVGAVDGRPGRLEDAPQPDDRDGGEAGAAVAEAALSAGRPGAGEHQGHLRRRGDDDDRALRRLQGARRLPAGAQGALRHRGERCSTATTRRSTSCGASCRAWAPR